MRSGGTPSSEMVIMARKKVAMATPCTRSGITKSQKLGIGGEVRRA